MALDLDVLAQPAHLGAPSRHVRLRIAVACYVIGCLLHVAHALAVTDPRTLRMDWDTFLAIELAIRAPLWPLTLLSSLLGLDILPAL